MKVKTRIKAGPVSAPKRSEPFSRRFTRIYLLPGIIGKPALMPLFAFMVFSFPLKFGLFLLMQTFVWAGGLLVETE